MPEPVPIQTHQIRPVLVNGADFLNEIPPPVFAVKPILQMGQVVSVTAQTNHGKSAFTNMIAVGIATGIAIGLFQFRKGKVLFLFGENVDNARMQLKAALLKYSVPKELHENFVIYPVCRPLDVAYDEIIRDVVARKLGPFICVIGDTNAAYWTGNEENSNTQSREQASLWRKFTCDALGKPVVVVNCHPTKGAGRDNLVPRGGSAFISEIDANITLWNDGGLLQIGYTKLRGPPFDPITVALRDQSVGFSDGTTIDIPVALPLTDEEAVEVRNVNRSHNEDMLALLQRMPDATLNQWAEALGWRTAEGKPYKTLVNRTLFRLEKANKVKKVDGRWVIKRDHK